ncbi:EpsG family protein [Myroides odoratimimus]|uniref:EpsG family protein n=1 Tax=Myroides odoratimimus TaxID=76832 RepID=UPI003D2F65D6
MGNTSLVSYYNKNSQYNFSILAFVCFLISPILSLPFILLGIFNRERLSLFLTSLFIGVLSYYLIPAWELDISRYYLMYQEISMSNYNGFKLIVAEQNDYVFFFLYYLLSRFGISFQFLLLIISTFNFYTCLLVGDLILKRSKASRNSYFMLMGSLILSLPILSMVSVSRFALAFSFFMLFVYYHLKKNTKLSYSFMALSCFTHFAFAVYVPFLVLFNFYTNRTKINRMLMVICFFVLVFTATGGLLNVLQRIPIIGEKAMIYLDVFEESNIFILSMMLLIPMIISVFFYMRFYSFIPTQVLQIFLACLIVALICIPTNMIIYDRYIQVFKPVFALTIMATCYSPNIVSSAKILLLKKIVFIVTIFYAMYYFYTFYIIYKDSFRGFISLSKLLLISILDSSYTQHDFY